MDVLMHRTVKSTYLCCKKIICFLDIISACFEIIEMQKHN